jgi:mono/diheme cytochrome c family protein
VRTPALTALGLLTLAGLAGFLFVTFASARARIFHPPNDDVAIPSDAASIARGKHLVEAIAVCTICHGDDLGGKLAFDDPALGHAYTANLTKGRGGIGQHYTNADWIRSIRYGVRPNGHGIIFMPSEYYNHITDADLGAIIAYATSVPPVDNEQTKVEIKPLIGVLIDLGIFGDMVQSARIDFVAERPPPPRDPGAYIVSLAGCTFCHGLHLTGGQGPETGAPPAPDLTSGGPLQHWSLADFISTLRTGKSPQGLVIDPKFMPWLGYRNMTDDELALIWRYLRTLPPAAPA